MIGKRGRPPAESAAVLVDGRSSREEPTIHGGAYLAAVDAAAGGRPGAAAAGEVDVVVMAGEAGAEDVGETVVTGLLRQGAEGVDSRQVGRVSIKVTAVGGATDRRVTRHTAETAGDVDGASPSA